MGFRTDFVTALRGGADYDVLMELVRRHRLQGLSVDEAYQTLHQIWLELGFNEKSDGGDFQDNLEAVMEKVWYGHPVLEEPETSAQ